MASKGGGRRGRLSKALESHIQNIRETFQMLENPAPASLDKVDWSEVVKLGGEVSKQATVAGMLWNGEARETNALEENMEAYFNMLQGFILLCHGSTVGAGPTLHENIHTSAKQIVDCSISLLRQAVSIYADSRTLGQTLTIPQLSGSVWEACASLKKIPTTNCTAIGRAITQVAVSVKDVLREMKELKPTADVTGEPSGNGESDNNQDALDDILSDGGLGDDLTPEEMIVAQRVIDVTANSLDALKEVIRFVSSLLKNSSIELDSKDFVESLERILSYCREVGSQVSELGACVYPPQEISEMQKIAKKITHGALEIRREAVGIDSSKEKSFLAFQELETALERLHSCLSSELESEMGKLALQ